MPKDTETFLRKKPQSGSMQTLYAFLVRFLTFVSLFLGMWASTQYFAYLVRYNPDICGYPAIIVKKYPLYWPWMYFSWLIDYIMFPAFVPILKRGLVPWVSINTTAILLYVSFALLRSLKSKTQNIFASGRMALAKELKTAGMLRGEGIPLCQLDTAKVKILIQKNGDLSLKTVKEAQLVNAVGKSHILVSAPPRSYKGVSVLIPFLLQYKHSVFVTDYKGELYAQTAGWRKKFSRIILYSPGASVSTGFNFLMAIRPDADAWVDAMMLATTFLAPKKEEREDDNTQHFRVAATLFLAGLILHILCGPAVDKSLGGVLDFLLLADCGDDEKTGEKSAKLLHEMIHTDHCNQSIHKKVVMCANAQLSRPSRERGSVTSTVLKALSVFMDDRIRQNTSRHDFNYEDFIDSDVPLSLYFTVSNAKIDQYDVLIKAFVTMFLRRLTDGETSYDDIRLKKELVFALDEFHALGAFNFLQKAMAIVPGYGVRFLLVSQSFSQLESVYGKDHQFMSLCKHIVIYAPGDFATAKHFSEVIGKDSIWKTSVSNSGNRMDVVLGNINQSGSETERYIIRPEELMRLPFNRCLVFTQGLYTYMGKKIISYDDFRYKNKIYDRNNKLKELVPSKSIEEVLNECAPLRKNREERAWYELPLFTCLENYEDICISEALIDPQLQIKSLIVEAFKAADGGVTVQPEKQNETVSALLVGI